MLARLLLLSCSFTCVAIANAGETTEFCLDGEFNIGARLQGTFPDIDEFVPTRWCVMTDDISMRTLFTATGKANPDMDDDWSVAFLPPDLVRIVNADDPPDIEFHGADSLDDAARVRRLDPRRLAEERPDESLGETKLRMRDGRVHELKSVADLPLRGRVPVRWIWNWDDTDAPHLRLEVDGRLFFRATGTWRVVEEAEAERRWRSTPGVEPVQVPGDRWPSRVSMRRIDVVDDVHLVRGVRSGFQHLVVNTASGLVIADAPAGWVEFHHIPPADLVPGLGISGLSERLVDFLATEFPGKPIRAVILTHAHDDHAGGARAFAAAGAKIYAPAESAEFLETALNRNTMPNDRLAASGGGVAVIPVEGTVRLDDAANPVSIVSVGAGPHASAVLGVHAESAGFLFVSDIHVPRSDADEPSEERAGTECWFAGWADKNLPAETIVLNSHSPQQTPVSRLAKYLESAQCRDNARR